MTNDTKISYRENNSTTFLIKFFFQQRLRQCIQRFGEFGDHIVCSFRCFSDSVNRAPSLCQKRDSDKVCKIFRTKANIKKVPMVKIICYVQYRDMNYFLGERKYEKLLYAKCSFVQSIEKCPINVVWEQNVQLSKQTYGLQHTDRLYENWRVETDVSDDLYPSSHVSR